MAERAKITLELSNKLGNYELSKISFFHPILGTTIEIERGRNGGIRSTDGGFPWTAGVQALSLFFIKAKLLSIKSNENESYPILIGEKSSAASSLDYTISRQSNWLLDCFGVDKNGASLLKRIIRRTNPERKRPGPVMLFLNHTALDPKNIFITCNDQECEINILEKIISTLSSNFCNNLTENKEFQTNLSTKSEARLVDISEQKSQRINEYTQLGSLDFLQHESVKHWFKKQLIEELNRSLKCGMDFSKENTKAKINRLITNSTFQKQTLIKNDFFEPILENSGIDKFLLSSSSMTSHELIAFSSSPVQIHSPICSYAMAGIINLAEHLFDGACKLKSNYITAGCVLKKMLSRNFDSSKDLFVLGEGHLSELLASSSAKSFKAVMMAPDLSFKFISTSSNKKEVRQIEILDHPRSSSRFLFEDLKQQGHFMKTKLIEKGAEDIVYANKPDIDSACLQWFPHYNFSELFNFSDLNTNSLMSIRSNFIIAHVDFFKNKRRQTLLNLIIRECWLRLLESEKTREFIVNNLSSCQEKERFVSRLTGLHLKKSSEFNSIISRLSR